MSETGRLQGVADEGGYWPVFESNEDGLETAMRAIESAGLTPGQDIGISLDIAASQFGHGGHYRLARDGRDMDSDELSGLLVDWIERYPIVSYFLIIVLGGASLFYPLFTVLDPQGGHG